MGIFLVHYSFGAVLAVLTATIWPVLADSGFVTTTRSSLAISAALHRWYSARFVSFLAVAVVNLRLVAVIFSKSPRKASCGWCLESLKHGRFGTCSNAFLSLKIAGPICVIHYCCTSASVRLLSPSYCPKQPWLHFVSGQRQRYKSWVDVKQSRDELLLLTFPSSGWARTGGLGVAEGPQKLRLGCGVIHVVHPVLRRDCIGKVVLNPFFLIEGHGRVLQF